MSVKISVLMSVFNGGKFLREAIDSILGQTFKNFEFLIIDDGSSDNSVHIINSYKDPRIKLIRNSNNMGLIYSLNKGLALARGEYIARMDADDISLPKRLERQFNFMEKNPSIGISSTWIKMFKGFRSFIHKNKTSSEEIKAALLFRSALVHSSAIIKKSVVDKYNLQYDKKHLHAEDYGLWVRCSSKFPLANIPDVLLNCRLSNNSVTQNADRSFEERNRVHKLIYKEALENFGINPKEEDLDLHRTMLSSYPTKNQEQLNEFYRWLNKLKQINRDGKIYPEQLFNKEVATQWFWVCYKSTKIGGLNAWNSFWKDSMSKDTSITNERRIKFAIRCLLK